MTPSQPSPVPILMYREIARPPQLIIRLSTGMLKFQQVVRGRNIERLFLRRNRAGSQRELPNEASE